MIIELKKIRFGKAEWDYHGLYINGELICHFYEQDGDYGAKVDRASSKKLIEIITEARSKDPLDIGEMLDLMIESHLRKEKNAP